MNTYYSMIGRLLDERTPIHNEGYYILTDTDEVGYSVELPAHIEIVSIERFTQILVEGSKKIIQSFATSPHNKDVYAITLHADEYPYIRVYINTLDRFNKTLHRYQENGSDYSSDERKRGLKYNRGDFDFEYWDAHMGDWGKYIPFFESIFEMAPDMDKDQKIGDMKGNPVIAFESGVIENGYYVCALKATQQLIAENAFDCLHKTDDFIAYTSVGIENLEYSLVMRKTINLELLYSIFPDIKEKDIRFNKLMEKNKHLSLTESLSYWSEAMDNWHVEILVEHDKPELEVFLQLERYGNELAQVCLEKVNHLVHLDNLEGNHFGQICFYIEALHFAGALTEEQLQQCKIISSKLREIDDENPELPKELDQLVLQHRS